MTGFRLEHCLHGYTVRCTVGATVDAVKFSLFSFGLFSLLCSSTSALQNVVRFYSPSGPFLGEINLGGRCGR